MLTAGGIGRSRVGKKKLGDETFSLDFVEKMCLFGLLSGAISAARRGAFHDCFSGGSSTSGFAGEEQSRFFLHFLF